MDTERIVTARAITTYEERARVLFTREDRYKARGDAQRAADCHWAGVIAAHAARAEQTDPDVRR